MEKREKKTEKPLVICITGGVGSGKSYVCDLIAEQMKLPVIDSDMTTRVKVMSRGCTGYERIVKTFGEEILDAELDIDRKKLASIVFSDPDKLEELNKITHPATVLEILKMIKYYKDKNAKVVFVESAIPFGAGYMRFCDEFWYVHAPVEQRVERLRKSRNYSIEKCIELLESQMSDEEYFSKVDRVLENADGTSDNTLKSKIVEYLRGALAKTTNTSETGKE